MKQSLIIVCVTLAMLLVLAYFTGGSALILKGLSISMNTAYKSALMIIVSFIIIGQLNELLSAEKIKKWMQEFSGIKAIIISAFAGGLFPGGPYIYYPFSLGFKEKKLPAYIIIAFLLGKQVYDLTRIPMEASLINPETALIRNLITLPVPIIAGLIAKRFFSSDECL